MCFTENGVWHPSHHGGCSYTQKKKISTLELLVHFVNLSAVLLRRNRFTWIQEAVMDETGRKPPNSHHNLFLVQFWPREVVVELLRHPTTVPNVAGCRRGSTSHHTSQSAQEMGCFRCAEGA